MPLWFLALAELFLLLNIDWNVPGQRISLIWNFIKCTLDKYFIESELESSSLHHSVLWDISCAQLAYLGVVKTSWTLNTLKVCITVFFYICGLPKSSIYFEDNAKDRQRLWKITSGIIFLSFFPTETLMIDFVLSINPIRCRFNVFHFCAGLSK